MLSDVFRVISAGFPYVVGEDLINVVFGMHIDVSPFLIIIYTIVVDWQLLLGNENKFWRPAWQ